MTVSVGKLGGVSLQGGCLSSGCSQVVSGSGDIVFGSDGLVLWLQLIFSPSINLQIMLLINRSFFLSISHLNKMPILIFHTRGEVFRLS